MWECKEKDEGKKSINGGSDDSPLVDFEKDKTKKEY